MLVCISPLYGAQLQFNNIIRNELTKELIQEKYNIQYLF